MSLQFYHLQLVTWTNCVFSYSIWHSPKKKKKKKSNWLLFLFIIYNKLIFFKLIQPKPIPKKKKKKYNTPPNFLYSKVLKASNSEFSFILSLSLSLSLQFLSWTSLSTVSSLHSWPTKVTTTTIKIAKQIASNFVGLLLFSGDKVRGFSSSFLTSLLGFFLKHFGFLGSSVGYAYWVYTFFCCSFRGFYFVTLLLLVLF